MGSLLATPRLRAAGGFLSLLQLHISPQSSKYWTHSHHCPGCQQSRQGNSKTCGVLCWRDCSQQLFPFKKVTPAMVMDEMFSLALSDLPLGDTEQVFGFESD